MAVTFHLFELNIGVPVTLVRGNIHAYLGFPAIFFCFHVQRRSQEFDLGGYKLHDIEFVLGQGDKTTT